MSNELPAVSSASVPVAGAVQRYQSEAPPALFAWRGSSSSTLASAVDAETEPAVPESACAASKRSFAGAVARRQFNTRSPRLR